MSSGELRTGRLGCPGGRRDARPALRFAPQTPFIHPFVSAYARLRQHECRHAILALLTPAKPCVSWLYPTPPLHPSRPRLLVGTRVHHSASALATHPAPGNLMRPSLLAYHCPQQHQGARPEGPEGPRQAERGAGQAAVGAQALVPPGPPGQGAVSTRQSGASGGTRKTRETV